MIGLFIGFTSALLFAETEETAYSAAFTKVYAGEWNAAAQAFTRIASSNTPFSDAAHYWSAYSLSMAGRKAESLRVFQSLVKRFPDSEYIDDSLYQSAFILKDLGKWKEAEKTLHKLLKEYPDSYPQMVREELRRPA